MKKLAIALAIFGAAAVSYGQGYVTVTGTSTVLASTNTTLLSSSYTGGSANSAGTYGIIGAASTGQSYYAALLTTTVSGASTAFYENSSAISSWVNALSVYGTNSTAANGRVTIGSGLQTVNGTAAVGNSQEWLLVTWSSSLGSSWSQVAAELASGSFTSGGYIGWSTVITGAAGAAAPATPLTISGAASPLLTTGWTLEAVPSVPEPGTLALAALGGASLLLFRRKK